MRNLWILNQSGRLEWAGHTALLQHIESTSMTSLQQRNNVVYAVGVVHVIKVVRIITTKIAKMDTLVTLPVRW